MAVGLAGLSRTPINGFPATDIFEGGGAEGLAFGGAGGGFRRPSAARMGSFAQYGYGMPPLQEQQQQLPPPPSFGWGTSTGSRSRARGLESASFTVPSNDFGGGTSFAAGHERQGGRPKGASPAPAAEEVEEDDQDEDEEASAEDAVQEIRKEVAKEKAAEKKLRSSEGKETEETEREAAEEDEGEREEAEGKEEEGKETESEAKEAEGKEDEGEEAEGEEAEGETAEGKETEGSRKAGRGKKGHGKEGHGKEGHGKEEEEESDEGHGKEDGVERFAAKHDYPDEHCHSQECLQKPWPRNQLQGTMLDTSNRLPLCSRFYRRPCDVAIVDGELVHKKPSREEQLAFMRKEEQRLGGRLMTSGYAGAAASSIISVGWKPSRASFFGLSGGASGNDFVRRMEEEEAHTVAAAHPQDYGVVGSANELLIVLGPPATAAATNGLCRSRRLLGGHWRPRCQRSLRSNRRAAFL